LSHEWQEKIQVFRKSIFWMGAGMMKKTKGLLLFALFLSATACSNKAIYMNAQTNLRTDCHRGPMSQYQECMARTSTSYEEYLRDREEALKNR
jgi:hypothetical protein